MFFVHGLHKQQEYCLSFAQILSSRYQSIIDDRMKIKRISDEINVLEENRPEKQHCPVMKDQ